MSRSNRHTNRHQSLADAQVQTVTLTTAERIICVHSFEPFSQHRGSCFSPKTLVHRNAVCSFLIQPKLGHERQLSMFGMNTPRQPKKSLFSLICDVWLFSPCHSTHVICCLCRFKSGVVRGWSGRLHDGNCHLCPIDGFCQDPANPQSNPGTTTGKSDTPRQAEQDSACSPMHSQHIQMCTHSHKQTLC